MNRGRNRNVRVPAAVNNNAPANRQVYQTVLSNARRFQIPVVSDTDSLAKFLKQEGLPTRVVNGYISPNPHSRSAAIRSYASVEALRLLYEVLSRDATRPKTICDLYASNRTASEVAFLNSNLDPAIQNNNIILRSYRPLITPGDINRYDANASCSHADMIDSRGYIAVNIYNTHMGPWNQQTVHRLLHRNDPLDRKVLMWVGHKMLDTMGTIHNEGGWIKTLDNTEVLFRPDKLSEPYPKHKDCSWMFNSSSWLDVDSNTFLVWSIQRVFSGFTIIQFTVVDTIVEQTHIPIPTSFFHQLPLFVYSKNYFTKNFQLFLTNYFPRLFVQQFLQQKTLAINYNLFSSIISKVASSGMTKMGLRQCTTLVHTALNADPDYSLLRTLFPSHFLNYASELSHAVFTHGLDERLDALDHLTSLNDTFCHINSSEANIGVANASNPWIKWKSLIWLIFGTIGLYKFITFLMRKLLSKIIVKCSSVLKILVQKLDSLNPRPLAIVPSRPYLSAVIETVATSIYPPISQIFASFETARELMQPNFSWYNVLQPWVFHCGSAYLFSNTTFMKRLLYLGALTGVHCFYNIPVPPTANYSLLQKLDFKTKAIAYKSPFYIFKENITTEEWESRKPWEPTTYKEPIPLDQCFFVAQKKSYFTPDDLDPLMKVTHKNWILPGPVPQATGFYSFLVWAIPAVVPARTDENLEAVIMSRILKPPPMDPYIQEGNWTLMDNLVQFLFPERMIEINREDHIEEWYSHFTDSKKKQRYKIALADYDKYGHTLLQRKLRHVAVMVKTDELLLKTFPDHSPYMKPRAIANVNPVIQAYIGPAIYEASIRLKALWDFKLSNPYLLTIPDSYGERIIFHIYLTYAGSSTDDALSRWYQRVLYIGHPAIFIMVSGDDSLVVYSDTKTLTFYEADASMFDQSQSFGPLRFERMVLYRLGCSVETCDILEQLSTSPYVAWNRDKTGSIKIDRTDRPIRDTGGADTSLGNSINMASAWLAVCSQGYTDSIDELRERFGFLGFDMKIRVHSRITQTSFLKGTWYDVLDPEFMYYWAPLPSRILKLTKSLRDPRGLYHTKDFHEASSQFVNDVLVSYSPFMEIPILRVLVKNFCVKDRQIINFYEEYKVQATLNTPKPRFDPTENEDIYLRYGSTKEEFEDLESHIPPHLFWFVDHALLRKLAGDYN